MTSRRSPANWWVSRSERRNPQAQPNRHNFDLYGPQPLRLLPKPTVRSNRTVEKQTRMQKFTSVELRLLDEFRHRLFLMKTSGEYGYAQKLVKRGYFRQIECVKGIVELTITSAGERARAGMALLKSVEGKRGIASGKAFGHAAAG